MRRLWPGCLLLLTIGCHTLPGAVSPEAVPSAPLPAPQVPATAPPGETPDQASLAQSHLRLASACLEKGDQDQACRHLSRYVELHPDHRTGRLFFAEVLYKLAKLEDARRQYELVSSSLLDESELDCRSLSHCHGRLMKIAEETGDVAAEHLYRGLGLYWLAQERARLPEPDGDFSVEALVCRTIGELSRARALRPKDARTHWYLHCCWQMLGQSSQAQARLAEAERCALFSPLCPAEQRGLVMATRRLSESSRP